MKKIILTLLCALTVSIGMAQNTTSIPQPDDSFMPHGGTHGWNSNEGPNNYYQNTENNNSKISEEAPDKRKKKAEKEVVATSYTKGYAAKKLKQAEKLKNEGKYADAVNAYTAARKATLAKDSNANVSNIDKAIAECQEKISGKHSCCH